MAIQKLICSNERSNEVNSILILILQNEKEASLKQMVATGFGDYIQTDPNIRSALLKCIQNKKEKS